MHYDTCVRCKEKIENTPPLSRSYCNICDEEYTGTGYTLCLKCIEILYEIHVGEKHTSIELVD